MDVIVTVDLYLFDVESIEDAKDKALAAIERSGLTGDVQDAFQASRDERKD
jgi:hypothetical protein